MEQEHHALLENGSTAPYYNIDEIPSRFEGGYARHNVPYHFELLVMGIYSLREQCDTPKYQPLFSALHECLKALLWIIVTNDFAEYSRETGTGSIDQRLQTLNAILQSHIKLLHETKTKHNSQFDETISECKSRAEHTFRALDNAFQAHEREKITRASGVGPGDQTIEATPPAQPSQLPNFTPKEIDGIIELLKTPPTPYGRLHFIAHAYTHEHRLLIAGAFLLLGAPCISTTQLLLNHYAPNIPNIILPAGFAGVGILLIGLAIIKSYWTDLRKTCFGEQAQLPDIEQGPPPLIKKSESILKNLEIAQDPNSSRRERSIANAALHAYKTREEALYERVKEHFDSPHDDPGGAPAFSMR